MKINQYYKILAALVCVLLADTAFSQNVGISSSSSFTPDASAGLDVSYTNKGLLMPRVALTATNAAGPITSPAISLLVYNTATAGTSPNNVVPGYYYWNGVAWTALTTGAPTANSAWYPTGNTGTTAGTNFIGTTDAVDFVFKTNNVERARFTSGGNFGVGSTAFNATNPEQLLVDAGASSFNVISGKGNLNNYLQLNIQNTNAGTIASSDVVATADNGNETTNYVDMGINSSANTSAYFGAANDAYLYNAGGSTGGNFFIGTSSSGKSLGFLTGGGATTNERMRIDGNGNVGIGTTTPTQKLDITGNLKLSGAFMPGNSAGTAGYFLVSSGSGAAPIWYNATAYINTAAWVLAGNPGTNPATSFIGTTDAQDFVLRTNNAERARVTSAGSFGIGSTAFNSTNPEKLLVDAGASSFNVISGKGNLNNYLQLNIQNTNAGTIASSDVVATADNGNETTNYVDMGINSSANTSAYFGAANDAYLYNAGGSTGGNFFIGTSTSGKSLGFLTGGGATTNERMRIDGTSGNVGIGTITPSTKLHVFGANPLTLSGVVTGTNTTADSLLTITNGLVRKLPMATFASNGNDWSTTGNAGTTAGTNFIGTTDATDFVVKTNNTEIARFNTAGNVGIGSSAFNSSNPEQLLVDAGTASSYNVISGKGRLNNYLQLNIQNTSAGGNASSDIVASNNTATESVNYVDLGINSSGNTSTGVLGGASTVYLYGTGNDFAIGNGTSGKNLLFFTGGTGSNERMRIDGSGNVGIGTTPSQKLDVNGNINAASSIFLDGTNSNTGTKTPGLYFGGSGSGEVIASKRNTGTDQYGIDFYTSSNLRMSVTNNGNVGIGTITPGSKLTVAGDIAPVTDAGSNLGTSSARWSNIYAANGTINTSDRRLKTNIKNLNYGLKEILALQPVSYNWKKTPHTDKQLGLIAQDVRKIVPEVVVGDEAKENLGMKYAELVPVLINAIKEQQHEIDDLKKAVQKLQK